MNRRQRDARFGQAWTRRRAQLDALAHWRRNWAELNPDRQVERRAAKRAERRLFHGTDERFRARTARWLDRIPQVTRRLATDRSEP